MFRVVQVVQMLNDDYRPDDSQLLRSENLYEAIIWNV